MFLVAIFILRNVMRSDYRSEEMSYLKGSGMTDEEIERYIPKTSEERKQYAADRANDLDRMKRDIAYLLNEVSELRGLVKDPGVKGQRDAGLREMDHIHEIKRKAKEEKLLKEHPNFKPSPRLSQEERFKMTNKDETEII